MKNFNWEEFKSRDVAVCTSSTEQFNDFKSRCKNNNIRFDISRNLTSGDSMWFDCIGEHEDYYIDEGFRGWYKDKNYQLIEWTLEDNGTEATTEEQQQEQTEFTYQEVIARIKDGETYGVSPTTKLRLLQISRKGDSLSFSGEFVNEYSVFLETKYKLQETKKQYTIHYVEHTVDGDTYKFKRDKETDMFIVGEGVICNTEKMGRTYGKVKEIKAEELTQKEYESLDTIELITK